ncbi:sugar kinase [Streptomyces sp. NPDC006193]|uniref:sugar kinase n=1 Tax=Streptomyces sp. NPDC006193 TaxID=3155717 RepID=UPI0033B249B2
MDVVTLGESMVTFLPGRPGRLADVPSFHRSIGGAESNVACALAAFGHTARWVGRIGADGFGDHLVERIAGYGVDVRAVRRDPGRPTGVYFRTAGDRGTGGHEVAYYRAGSAASAMSVRNVDPAAVRAGRVLHLTGITAALSADCRDLLRALTRRHPGRPLVSFDVNHRPGLWRESGDAHILLELARDADIVFVGEDEAEEAWGLTGGPAAIRRALPEPAVLVVKQGARGATAFARGAAGDADGTQPPPLRAGGDALSGLSAGGDVCSRHPADSDAASGRSAGEGALSVRSVQGPSRGGTGERRESPLAEGSGEPGAGAPTGPGAATQPRPAPAPAAARPARALPTAAPAASVPALRVDVVAATGAGDAFAAGFLSATLRGLPLAHRLRHGHLFAAAALTAPGDLAAPPARGHADRLAALDDDAWGRLRLGPGWTQAERAEEEANTP